MGVAHRPILRPSARIGSGRLSSRVTDNYITPALAPRVPIAARARFDPNQSSYCTIASHSTVDAQRARQKFVLTARPHVKPVQSANEEQDLRGELPMTDLVVIAFPTEAKAEEVRQKLLKMQKEYLIELGDAAIAVKDAQGHIKLNQLINTTKAGAVGGTFGVR